MPCQGVYYRPRTAPRAGVLASHYNVDFAEHYLAEPLARRGFGFLGWNTRYRGNEPYFLLEHALVDIAEGVRWLRDQGLDYVVLLGNSGGGSLMAAYQSQALEPSIEPLHGTPPSAELGSLPSGDFYVAVNSHLGRPEMLTSMLDPSVTDERDPLSVDPALDMFDPRNGPPFAEGFVARYRAAQQARNHRISQWCLGQLDRFAAAGLDDRVFEVYRTWADLKYTDLTLDPTERRVGCYLGPDVRRANYGPRGIGQESTCRTWLSMWSLSHSRCSAEPHLRRITSPALVIQAMADTGVYPDDARRIFDALAAEDKQLQFMAGDHYLQTPASAREEAADRIADWLEPRMR